MAVATFCRCEWSDDVLELALPEGVTNEQYMFLPYVFMVYLTACKTCPCAVCTLMWCCTWVLGVTVWKLCSGMLVAHVLDHQAMQSVTLTVRHATEFVCLVPVHRMF